MSDTLKDCRHQIAMKDGMLVESAKEIVALRAERDALKAAIEAVAKKFDEWPTLDLWRSEAAAEVRAALQSKGGDDGNQP
jgi:hypothetical protein